VVGQFFRLVRWSLILNVFIGAIWVLFVIVPVRRVPAYMPVCVCVCVCVCICVLHRDLPPRCLHLATFDDRLRRSRRST
jgi:hypothetical protein